MRFPESSNSPARMPGSENALPNYGDMAEIGQGASGVVFKARDLNNDGKFVAIKKFKVLLSDDGGVPASIMREVATLKQLSYHPNVIKLLDVCNGPCLDREKHLLLYLVFEHMEMDLAEYVKKCPAPGVPAERICHLMRQLFSGVDFLHSRGIIHRDLKPQNLLVNLTGELKIADMGLAKLFQSQVTMTSVVATLWYRSPEVLLGGSYATPLDMWSCGCIMAEMFKGAAIFPGVSEADQLRRILSVIGTPTEEEWPANSELPRKFFGVFPRRNMKEVALGACNNAADLLDNLLQFLPSKRLHSQEVLNHAYFKDEQLASALDGIGPDK